MYFCNIKKIIFGKFKIVCNTGKMVLFQYFTTPLQVSSWMRQIDGDRDGKLSYKEFKGAVKRVIKERD